MEHITYGQFNCKEINELTSLRWYGTPCNIFMDERVLKYDYDQGFKNVKIYNICPQKRLKEKRVKDSNLRPIDCKPTLQPNELR